MSSKTPQDQLDELLAADPVDTGQALVLMLDVLQRVAVGEQDADRADRSFCHLITIALSRDGSLLHRLVDDDRTRHLPAPTLSLVCCLRLLVNSDVAAARAYLSELIKPGASQPMRLVAASFLLRDGRVADAAALLSPRADDPFPSYSQSQLQSISASLLRRARPGRSAGKEAERDFLSVCTAVRNEAPYLAEWVAFHHLQGVERFYIYENESTDGTLALLEQLATQFPIEVVPCQAEHANLFGFGDALERFGNRTEWLACIDADEFLIPASQCPVPEQLNEIEPDVAAVVINWRIFGSSGHDSRPSGLTIENYLHRAPLDHPVNQHVKSIVRPARCIGTLNPHQFLVAGRQMDAAFREVIPLAGRVTPPKDSRLSVHHYVVRSRQDYQIKRARGRPDPGLNRRHEDSYFAVHDRNEVVDRSALRFAAEVRQRMRACGEVVETSP